MLCQDIIEIIWVEVRVAPGQIMNIQQGNYPREHLASFVSCAQLFLIVFAKGQCYEIFNTSYHQKQFHRSPVLNGPKEYVCVKN